ncbi:MAG: N-acetylmuramoyl-L-alanine amidase, partial [Flammeovirgaceae bacterium]|nr:N-acetylmuramoyl-L-alanine amidase [Flammeovirgaceae bacterium]MDW8288316.1 N-acetylmuramoyl-L-alanine amidase [Flammeovirgaceae bacterium]
DDIMLWKQTEFRVASCVIIAGKPYPGDTSFKDGDIFQCFPAKYWALHLATHAPTNKIPLVYKNIEHTRTLEKHSISIVLCNAGWLTWENGRFYSSFRTVIPEEEVVEYLDKYRGKRFFHKYTHAQIESLRQLLVFLCEHFGIPKTYKTDMWNISRNALEGNPGIYTHASVRSDVFDCHPQPELVRMLRELDQPDDTPELTSTTHARNASEELPT